MGSRPRQALRTPPAIESSHASLLFASRFRRRRPVLGAFACRLTGAITDKSAVLVAF
jgi:hypothetical protein